MTNSNDAMREALRKTEIALAQVLDAADFVREDAGAPDLSQVGPQQSRIRAEIINCIRKIRINRELGEYYYVAVAGGQSAGKTRLIRELYGLDETWLADNEGRGERLPVFIIETPNIEVPKAVQIVIDPKTCETTEEDLTPEEFRALITGRHQNANALFPRLHVPRRHFPTERLGFVLLPGFEKENDGNASWQEVMRHTLRHALGCLFVTDKSRLADNLQLAMQKELSQSHFGGRDFAVAITKTENAEVKARDQLHATAMSVFGLGNDQKGQVVCTGIGAEFVAEWSEQLLAAINANSRAATSSFELRLNDLAEVAEVELLRILGTLNGLLMRGSVHESAAITQRDEVMVRFADAVKAYRRRLSRELGESTRALAAEVRAEANKAYIDEEEGFENTFVNNVKRFFNTTSGEREQIHIKRITERWSAERIARSDFVALSRLSSTALQIPCEPTDTSVALLETQPVRALGYDRIDPNSVAVKISESQNVRAHVVRLLQADKDREIRTFDEADRDSFNATLKLIPALTMEYLRMTKAVAFVGSSGNDGLAGKPDTESFGAFLEKTANSLPQFKQTATSLLRTVGCILAVDVAIDGTVDTIPSLIHAIFGGSTAGTESAGLGASLSMGAAAVIGLGFVAYQATTAAQRADAVHRGFIHAAISNLAALHVDRWLEVYDEAMDKVAERLHESLSHAYRLDTHLANNDSLLRAMGHLETARLNLVRNVSHAKHSLV